MKQELEDIITDLDGSLFTSDKRVNPRDLETIRRLKAKGVRVYLCTGRHFTNFHQEAAQVGLEYPVLANNGAHLYDFAAGTSLWEERIPPQTCRALVDFFRQREMPFVIYGARQVFVAGPPDDHAWRFYREYFQRCLPQYRYPVGEIGPDFAAEEHPTLQFMYASQSWEEAIALAEEMAPLGELAFFRSGHFLTDITISTVSKGAGVRRLAARDGFSLDHALAMGDSHNDLTMLQACRWSVAPANASPEVKEAVSFVSDSCDQGALTRAIRELFPHLLEE